MFFKAAEVHFQVTFSQVYSLLTLYQNKIRKLKHQSNSFASGGKLKTRTSHSIAYFRAKVYEQRKEHGKLGTVVDEWAILAFPGCKLLILPSI